MSWFQPVYCECGCGGVEYNTCSNDIFEIIEIMELIDVDESEDE